MLSRKCIISSYQSYGEYNNYTRDKDHILRCMDQPTAIQCLPDHGMPQYKFNVVAGFNADRTRFNTFKVSFFNTPVGRNDSAKAMRTSWEWLAEDYLERKQVELAQQNVTLKYLMSHDNVYTTDEHASYSTLFHMSIGCCAAHIIYLSIVLKQGNQPRIILATSIVLINALSIVSACGILSYFGCHPPSNLFDVMPFMVMAIGADNMAILVICNQYKNEPPPTSKSFGTHIGRTLCQIGPSLRVNAVAAIACCWLASFFTSEYAAALAVYLAVALTVNWLLQETCFVAILSLDLRRMAQNRCDPIFAIHKPTEKTNESGMDTFIRQFYVPLLRRKPFQVAVLILLFSSISVTLNHHFYIDVGEYVAKFLAKDPNVQEFTEFRNNLSMMGPPVYFIVSASIDYSININRHIIDVDYKWSIPNEICKAGFFAERQSYIEKTDVNSWWNDYQLWRLTPECCYRYINTNEYCQPDQGELKT